MHHITIADVAREAGVTLATVSHALGDNRPISDETRTRVLAAAERLDRVPSQSARSLALRRTSAVSDILARSPEVVANDSFFPAFIAGIKSLLARTEAALMLQVAPDRESEERADRALAHGRANGRSCMICASMTGESHCSRAWTSGGGHRCLRLDSESGRGTPRGGAYVQVPEGEWVKFDVEEAAVLHVDLASSRAGRRCPVGDPSRDGTWTAMTPAGGTGAKGLTDWMRRP